MRQDESTGDAAKRARILESAMTLVLAYGFSRTTMDDIAKAAEMSRPALYLVFRNKTDIFRAIAKAMIEQSTGAARACLSGEGRFSDRLFGAIDAAMISLFAPLQASPHGAELLDMKNSLAGDLTAEWRQAMVRSFGRAIADAAGAARIDLAARGLSHAFLADLILDGMEGAKMRAKDADEQRQIARGLVNVVDRAIQP